MSLLQTKFFVSGFHPPSYIVAAILIFANPVVKLIYEKKCFVV